MSAIANFKKRCEAEKAKASEKAKQATGKQEDTKAPENEALKLLAKLLGCEQSEAISKATEYAEINATIAFLTDEQLEKVFPKPAEDNETIVGVDLAQGKDSTAVVTATDGELADIKTDLQGSADAVLDAASATSDTADKVEGAAEAISDSATDISDASSELAYSVADIASAATDIKEAAKEIKKPSAAPKSSRSKKAAKPKKNSKK